MDKIKKNTQITAKQVRVIKDSENLGIMPLPEALAMAKELGLDLIQINNDSTSPICKILDWGKYNYELAKSKRFKPKPKLHEIVFGANITEYDLSYRLSHIREFLLKGDSVKVIIKFKGRQRAHKDIGYSLCKTINKYFPGYNISSIKESANLLTYTISP
jgi:translation initiation factor IF-3